MATTSKSRRPAKRAAKSWDSLPVADRERFARLAIRAVRAFGQTAGKYKIVSSTVPLRETGMIEHQNEDAALNPYQRARLLNLSRNAARNSSTLNSILKQFDLHGVGTVGGKATFSFEDSAAADRVKDAFSKWTRSCDFFDGLSANLFLKILLKTYILGGDCVILFDDKLVEDSGRILLYEPDEIGSLSEADFAVAWGHDKFRQSQGRVYNKNGRFVGVNVSRACRGMTTFPLDRCYTLKRDPNSSFLDEAWLMPRNVFRIAQGRGVTPLASPLSTILDLEDLTEYELQAAKKNSQTLAQVISTADQAPDPALTSSFAPGDFSAMTDAEIAAAVKEEVEEAPEIVTFDKLQSAAVIYEALPDGKKLELLDTKHPNAAMPEFIRWLAGRSAAPFGLGSVYATLKADASYTAFRGEQVMSQPAFEEAQKFLEQVCDWMLFRWSRWAVRKGIVAESDLTDGWLRDVDWQWPKMREVNQVDEQRANEIGLRLGTRTYKDIYGPKWRDQIAQRAAEVALSHSLNISHPSDSTAAGAPIVAPGDSNNNNNTQD